MEQAETFDFTGRKVMVIGAAGTIAGAVAFAFAEAGADIAVTTTAATSNDPEESLTIRRLAKSLAAMGHAGIPEAIDMSIGAAVQIGVRQVSKALGGIDILVIGVDAKQTRPTEQLSDADWSRLLSGNLSPVLFACRGAAKEMASRDEGSHKGRIILLLPNVENTAPAGYVATRIAVASLIPGLAREWAELPLTVHGVTLPAGLDDETSGADVAHVVMRLAGAEGDERNGRVLRTGASK